MRLTALTPVRQLLPLSQAAPCDRRPNKNALRYDLRWQLISTRCGLAKRPILGLADALTLLDKGFFFPITHPWVSANAPYKSFMLTSRGSTRHHPRRFAHQHLAWEILESLRSTTVLPEPQTLLASAPLFATTPSRSYSGVRHSRWGGAALIPEPKGLRRDPFHAQRQRRSASVPNNGDNQSREAHVPIQILPPISPLLSPMGLSSSLRSRLNNPDHASLPNNGTLKPAGLAPCQDTRLLMPLRRLERWRGYHKHGAHGAARAIPQVRYKPGLAKA